MTARLSALPALKVFLLIGALLLAGATPAAAADSWRVRGQSQGLLHRLPDSSDWQPSLSGLELPPGTSVQASNGTAMLAQADNHIIMLSGGELTLPQPETEIVAQRHGRIRYQIRLGSTHNFGVQTPYLAIGIKGTMFDVLVSAAGAEVRVLEGRVAVSTPDGRYRVDLTPGQAARIGAAPGVGPGGATGFRTSNRAGAQTGFRTRFPAPLRRAGRAAGRGGYCPPSWVSARAIGRRVGSCGGCHRHDGRSPGPAERRHSRLAVGSRGHSRRTTALGTSETVVKAVGGLSRQGGSFLSRSAGGGFGSDRSSGGGSGTSGSSGNSSSGGSSGASSSGGGSSAGNSSGGSSSSSGSSGASSSGGGLSGGVGGAVGGAIGGVAGALGSAVGGLGR